MYTYHTIPYHAIPYHAIPYMKYIAISHDATICVQDDARICYAAKQTAIYDSATEEMLTDEKWTR